MFRGFKHRQSEICTANPAARGLVAFDSEECHDFSILIVKFQARGRKAKTVWTLGDLKKIDEVKTTSTQERPLDGLQN